MSVERAISNGEEKNGQGYFWDIPNSFPKEWGIPNKQIRILPEMSLPKTLVWPQVKNQQPDQTELNEQTHFWDLHAIPEDYISRNQQHWQNVDRGKIPITKPLIMRRSSESLHKKIQKTFDIEKPMPIIVWSVIYDRPKAPTSEYAYEYRLPEGISIEDRKNYFIGIERITEYATNFATKEYFRKRLNIPGSSILTNLYNRFSDLVTYRVLLRGTYSAMSKVERSASENGDYKQAVIDALFKHDFEPINELIEGTHELSASNINELAISLGKKRLKKPDLTKWFGKLEINDTDSEHKANIKNCMLSILAGGVYRVPGITEVSGGIQAFLIAETVAVYLSQVGANIVNEGVIKALAYNTAVALIPAIFLNSFIQTHESLHSYSSNEEYIGLIPATLVNKKITPKMSQLEESNS